MTRLDSLLALRDFIDHEIATEIAPTLREDNPLVVAVSCLYDVDPALVVGDGRGHRVTKVRHCVAWMLARGGMSMRDIAHALGYTDQTTARYACRRIERDTGTKALLRGIETTP